MSLDKAFMNLSGAMDIIKMSKNPLAPIYEAVTNSLEAMAQRRLEDPDFSSEITIHCYFTGLLPDAKSLEQIEITDNGIGFNENNFNRFCEFFDKSKGYDNRGTGRLQYFHRFQRIKVDSIFTENDSPRRRVIECSRQLFISTHEVDDDARDCEQATTVTLCDYSAEKQEEKYFSDLSLDDFVSAVKSHFLLRFYLDTEKENFQAPKIKIIFTKAGKPIGERVIDPENIPQPKEEGEIKVPYSKVVRTKDDKLEIKHVAGKFETIKWAHFVLPESELGKNGIYLCSKDIPVQSVKFDQLKKSENIEGNRFMTAFFGEMLDSSENVSDSVDSFTFPDKKEVEQMAEDMYFDPEKEFLIFDTIYEQVNKAIPSIYSDVLDVKEDKKKDIEEIAKAHGIPKSIISKAKIGLNDDEQTITKKLYKAQSDQLAEKSYKAKILFESLTKLDPTDERYQEEIHKKTNELSDLVDEQNKEELSRYIIRREMVTDVLRKILDEKLDYQNEPKKKGENKDREGLIHDLIFKRKSKTTHSLNDLWILNEEFMHYDGCSELPLNEIQMPDRSLLLNQVPGDIIESLNLKLTRRPDIFLYPQEEKCLIIELKEPNTDLSNHLQQLIKYCNLIANFGAVKITGFYCYLIGEKFNPITDLDGDYKETVNGDWIRPNISIVSMDTNRNSIANAQIEILKLSSIRDRAHRRNLSFAEKLGIPGLLAD